MDKKRLEKYKVDLKKQFASIENVEQLNDLKITYMGKKGIIPALYSQMRDVDASEKKTFGELINDLKNTFNDGFNEIKDLLEKKKIESLIANETIDVTLPATKIKMGSPHILEKLIEELESLFISMGYDVIEGPEVESDYYNFELLNLPIGHPARDAQDTFYITDEMLMRSQTSPVQVRTMLANKEKTSIRIVCPGKTYRRDNDDATHSHQFTQMEGLLIDKKISLADLKGTLDIIAKKLYGNDRETRFRPSFYPFTEPSVEFDISCFNCGKTGCHICKQTGWITVAGAGMVHPNVLNGCGYDAEKYTGFAFGFGVERLAMLKYGINDIRVFYTNDLRTLSQFARRDGDENDD
ncbi:MAG: phenylalanine--tRNA ligase subunit alpha [bacterium]|nr:phenylalanine--tRNA ligase subunit alpha [bacterium]